MVTLILVVLALVLAIEVILSLRALPTPERPETEGERAARETVEAVERRKAGARKDKNIQRFAKNHKG